MEMFVSVDMAETTVTQENSQQEVKLAVPVEGTEATESWSNTLNTSFYSLYFFLNLYFFNTGAHIYYLLPIIPSTLFDDWKDYPS